MRIDKLSDTKLKITKQVEAESVEDERDLEDLEERVKFLENSIDETQNILKERIQVFKDELAETKAIIKEARKQGVKTIAEILEETEKQLSTGEVVE